MNDELDKKGYGGYCLINVLFVVQILKCIAGKKHGVINVN